MEDNSPALSVKVRRVHVEYVLFPDVEQASLTPPIIQQALDRDRGCIFSGVCDSDELVATWIFPPFLGHKVSMR